jgi:hypothetical protein
MDQNQEIFARYANDPAFARVVAEFLRIDSQKPPTANG